MKVKRLKLVHFKEQSAQPAIKKLHYLRRVHLLIVRTPLII